MSAGDIIEHPGVVSRIDGQQITVTVLAQSACQACHAKGTCSMGGEEIKEVQFVSDTEVFSTGEKVNVVMRESTGLKAMFFAYFLPFILMLTGLGVLIPLTGSEGLAALAAIGILAVYYLVLYFLRGPISKKISFRVEKI